MAVGAATTIAANAQLTLRGYDNDRRKTKMAAGASAPATNTG